MIAHSAGIFCLPHLILKIQFPSYHLCNNNISSLSLYYKFCVWMEEGQINVVINRVNFSVISNTNYQFSITQAWAGVLVGLGSSQTIFSARPDRLAAKRRRRRAGRHCQQGGQKAVCSLAWPKRPRCPRQTERMIK